MKTDLDEIAFRHRRNAGRRFHRCNIGSHDIASALTALSGYSQCRRETARRGVYGAGLIRIVVIETMCHHAVCRHRIAKRQSRIETDDVCLAAPESAERID